MHTMRVIAFLLLVAAPVAGPRAAAASPERRQEQRAPAIAPTGSGGRSRSTS